MQHEVVHQHAGIGLPARQHPVRHPARGALRGVEPGHQPLRRRFLVPRGAVDLPGQEQPGHRPYLERRRQRPRVHMVVFDGIAGAQDPRLLQPRDGGDHRRLHIFRQAGRDAVRIDRVVVQPLGLQEDLVALAFGEAHHLVLDRGAVARPHPLDAPAIDRALVQVGADQRMRRGRGGGDAAGHLPVGDALRHPGQGFGILVPRLGFQRIPGDAAPVEAWRRAGLEPRQRQPEPFEGKGKADGGRIPHAPGRDALLPDMDLAAQEGAGRHDQGAAADAPAIPRQDCRHAAIGGGFDPFRRGGQDGQAGLRLEQTAHRLAIEPPVRLRPRAAHGRALGAVQHLHMDGRGVGGAGHDAVQRIHLPHQVAFADAPDGRVAGHLAQGLDLVGQQQGARAAARRGGGGLAARMPAAHDDDIEDQVHGRGI